MPSSAFKLAGSSVRVLLAALLAVFMGSTTAAQPDTKTDTESATEVILLAERSIGEIRQQVRDWLRLEATLPHGTQHAVVVQGLCELYVAVICDERFATSYLMNCDADKLRRRLGDVADDYRKQLRRDKVPQPASGESPANASQDPSGAAAGGPFDNGWELVALIQQVIEPDSWDVRGGPGVARYFGPSRALVVRATYNVHEQIRDLLRSLPR